MKYIKITIDNVNTEENGDLLACMKVSVANRKPSRIELSRDDIHATAGVLTSLISSNGDKVFFYKVDKKRVISLPEVIKKLQYYIDRCISGLEEQINDPNIKVCSTTLSLGSTNTPI